jgi:hypothetical protein
VEFGWRPFAQDLIKAYKTSVNLTTRLKQLVRDNGIPVKRRRVIDESIGFEVLCEGTFLGPTGHLGQISLGGNSLLDGFYVLGPYGVKDVGSPHFDGSIRYRYVKTTKVKTWFACTYKYYVPDIGSLQWTTKAVAALYGLRITPSTLWEVIPWSWLIDWWVNAGDVLSNLSSNAVDNEALINPGVMRTTEVLYEVEVDVSCSGYSDPFDPVYLPPYTAFTKWSRLETTKVRRVASPFGFGITTGSFTVKQWLILAALRISRGKL